MVDKAMLILGAVVLDLLIGDPKKIIHPVVLIGKLITALERKTYLLKDNARMLSLKGGLVAFFVVIFVYLITTAIIYFSYTVNQYIGLVVSLWIFATTIAITSLKEAALAIYKPLISGDIVEARKMLALVVGRDTDNLDEQEVARGAVETVAENTVDGVIAPIFYGVIGGPALAMTYKAINTMDSMLGYKNEKYLYFGGPAARLDDIANYIPARITGICMSMGALFLKKSSLNAIRCWIQDAHKHPSPNGGIPESIVAGILGIRLGGYNWYQGEKRFRNYLGRKTKVIKPMDINDTVKLMYITTFIFLVITLSLLFIIGG